MIGFRVVNLLIPEEPQTLYVRTPSGTWELEKVHDYANGIRAIQNSQCGITYSIEHPVSLGTDGAAACDEAIDRSSGTRRILAAVAGWRPCSAAAPRTV